MPAAALARAPQLARRRAAPACRRRRAAQRHGARRADAARRARGTADRAARCTSRWSIATAASWLAPARSAAACCRRTPRSRSALHGRRPAFADDTLGTDALRVYAAPLGELGRGPGAGGAVIVAGTTADIERTLDRTRTLVSLCALAAAALAAGLATLLTRRALRPACRACPPARGRSSAPATPSARLPLPATRDEVGQLAETLNAMLASLERAREAEHRFVGDASHELRTPLTALRGNAAYVARHGADPAVLADIEADAARLERAARRPARARPRGRCRAGARRARSTSRSSHARRRAPTSTRRSWSTRPGIVAGERAALERAVGNLVRNARRHGPARWARHARRWTAGRSASRTRAPARATPSARSSASGARAARAPGSAWRSCARSPSATAARSTSSGSRFTLALKELSEIGRTTASSPHEGPSP